MATQYAFGQIVTSGLVLALNAADPNSYPGSGTTWRDMSGNNNTGTLTNGPTFNSANGGSIVFDGVNDYVDCGVTPQMTGLINVSAGAWVYPQSIASTTVFVNRYLNTGGVGQGWLLGYTSAQKFIFDGREDSLTYLNCPTINTYSLNNWYYVFGTKSANQWSIYINGQLQNSLTLGNGITPFVSKILEIGALPGFSLYQPNRVGVVQIYNRALSATEILQNYNATKSRYNLT